MLAARNEQGLEYRMGEFDQKLVGKAYNAYKRAADK